MNGKKNNTNKKKSFYFEDYTESEILNKSAETKLVKILPYRVNFLFFTFSSLILIFSIKIIYLSLYPEKNYFSQKINHDFTKERGDIVDRNGTILARSIEVYSAGVRPKLIKDKEKFLLGLRLKFPELNANRIKKKLKKNKFFYIKKRLTDNEKTKLWLMGDRAIVLEKKQFRIYPQKNLFSHVLGQIDDSNFGISGVEKFFDDELKKKRIYKLIFKSYFRFKFAIHN